MTPKTELPGRPAGRRIVVASIVVSALVSGATTLIIDVVSEAAKRGASAKVVAHQLHAQIEILQDDIDQFSGLKDAKRLAEEWLNSRRNGLTTDERNGNYGTRVRMVDQAYRERLEQLVLRRESVEATWANMLNEKQNPVMLSEAIRSFEESDEMLADSHSLISNSDAAKLGPEIASAIIVFRQKRRDAYKLIRFMAVYVRDTKEAKIEDVSPYISLYFRNLVESFVALSELQLSVAKRREMGMLEYWLSQLSN